MRIALEVLIDPALGSMRVEGTDDILDIEVFDVAGALVRGVQVKSRNGKRPWGKATVVEAISRWVALPGTTSQFEFLTDGRLGPTAESLRDALNMARAGDLAALATYFDADIPGATLARLAEAHVTHDPIGVEAVLQAAEREVRSLLGGTRSGDDIDEVAEHAISTLFRELTNRAGKDDPAERVLTKATISDILGGLHGTPETDRWESAVRQDVVDECVVLDSGLMPVRYRDESALASSVGDNIQSLPQDVRPTLLSGRTGSGKSSAARLIAHARAKNGAPAVIVHAEAYVPGRFADTLATTLSQLLQRDLPSVVGEQALGDTTLTVLIDGASEIPAPTRTQLAADIGRHLARRTHAQLVLIGRDRAVLGSLLPTHTEARSLALLPLDASEREGLIPAMQSVREITVAMSGDAAAAFTRRTMAVVNKALGDASGNPMLLTMAVDALLGGQDITTDADIYAASVRRMAERANTTDIDLAVDALGIVFARLLDQGRRFAYQREYRRMLTEACTQLADYYFDISPEALNETIRKTGLLIPLGSDQLLVPVHDSYADYLAGRSNSGGTTRFPEELEADDQRRVEFAAHIGGLTEDTAHAVARALPYSLVSLAAYDIRTLTSEDSPESISVLLAELLPVGQDAGVSLWRIDKHVAVALTGAGDCRWITAPEAGDPADYAPRVVLPQDATLSQAAVLLWRTVLADILRAPRALPARRPRDIQDAVELLGNYANDYQQRVNELILALAPEGGAATLTAAVGPSGMTGEVHHATANLLGDYSVAYRRTETIDIVSAALSFPTVAGDGATSFSADSTLSYFLHSSPASRAAAALRSAINQLVGETWLE